MLEPSIRVLHALQATIYIAVIVGVSRDRAWAYGAGCVTAAVWNLTSLFVTGFIPSGVRALVAGHWGVSPLIPVVAAIGHCAMIVACLCAVRKRPGKARSWRAFSTGGAIAVGCLVGHCFT